VLALEGRHASALEWFERSCSLSGQRAWTIDGLARFLATCPDEGIRNPERAVALARRAVALHRKAAWMWGTLGIALYRQGNPTEALEALEFARSLGREDDATEGFFAAMACGTLGMRREAREWYEKAVELMAESGPRADTEGRFRAEAAELLGLE
jgi:tetratricopeptide (TPR) repeat protein